MDIEFYNKLNQALHGDAGKIDRVMRFRYLNEFVKPGQILFAGSSLMEQFPARQTSCATATAPFFPASANISHRQSCFSSPIIRSIRTSPTQA